MNSHPIPASTTASALTTQNRVIIALVLREVHTLYGDSKLGYLWAIIQTAFGIAVFWAFREILGVRMPHGMNTAVFLLCGFIPWYLVSNTLARCMLAVRANQALLTFPQVTELDLMIARFIVVWGTQLLSAILILSIVIISGQDTIVLRDPGTLAATLFFAPLLGLGLGLIFASLARFLPTLDQIIPMLLRLLFFASGIFYSVSELPARFSNILLLNHIAQLIEWQRYGFSASAAAPICSVRYIALWCAVSLCIGFLLERHARGRPLK